MLDETAEDEVKEQKVWFLGILVSTLAPNLLESALTGKGVVRGGNRVIWVGEGVITARKWQDC